MNHGGVPWPPAPPGRARRSRIPGSGARLCVSLVVAAAVAGCGGEALAQEPRIDILRYDLEITPSFADSAVRVRATVTIDNPELTGEFVFGLNDGYQRVGVQAGSGRASIERGPGYVVVHASAPQPETILRFDLGGKLGFSNDEKRAIVADSSLFLLWSDRWYPIDFNDWAIVRTELRLPEGFRAVAPGRRLEAPPPDGGGGGQSDGGPRESAAAGGALPVALRPIVFETTQPAVCYSVISDARWLETERTVNGIPMRVLLHPQSARFEDQVFTAQAEVLGFYRELHGGYPFDGYAFVTIPGIFARRAFPGFVGYSPRFLEKEFTTTGHDAHETALLWWFYTFRGRGPGAFQWTEGLGDYAEFLFDQATGRPVPAIFQRFRDEYRALPDSADVPIGELSGRTPPALVHGKYPWLMHLLRGAVGDEPFRRALRLLFERWHHRACTLDEFVATLEEGAGTALDWWREDWLERPGVPDFVLAAGTKAVPRVPAGSAPAAGTAGAGDPGRLGSAAMADSVFETTVTLTQSLPPRRFPAEVHLLYGDRSRLESAWVDDVMSVWTVAGDSPPVEVRFDPNDWVPGRK